MKWNKTIGKALLGLATFVVAYLASNPALVTNFIPQDVVNMSVGGVVSAIITAVANWLKHKDDLT